MKNKNYDFIDVAKFFAMIFIVFMHSIVDNSNMKFKIVQVGCIAFFFFASGFVFKEEYKEYSLTRFVAKNIKSLLVPYFAFAGIGLIICYLVPSWYPENTFVDYMRGILYTAEPYGYGLVWFLLCLFEVRLAFYVTWKIVSYIKSKSIQIVLLILCAIVLYIANLIFYTKYYNLQIARLPLKLDSALIGLCYYILGFVFKYSGSYNYLSDKRVSFVVFIVTRLVATYIEINLLEATNISLYYFGPKYYLYFINQIIMIISYSALGSVFRDVKLFQYLGRNNLYIYLLHAHVLWFVEEIYCLITRLTRYKFNTWIEIIPISIVTYILSVIAAKAVMKIISYVKKA